MTAENIARKIQKSDTWHDDLNRQLCQMAGLLEEYDNSDGETFESVVFKAADILGVELL